MEIAADFFGTVIMSIMRQQAASPRAGIVFG
jgi:hypothetical protein